MIECPNIVRVDGKVVVIFCPQGLDKKIADYDDIYPNMYVIANDIDFENHRLINQVLYKISTKDSMFMLLKHLMLLMVLQMK